MQQVDSPLLRQLQQRFIALAGIEAAWQAPTRTLITALFNARQAGIGVVAIADIEAQLDVTLLNLQAQTGNLIGDANGQAPIVIFSSFVAFRRTYQQLSDVITALTQRQTLTPPSQTALAKIDWQFGNGTLSAEQRLAVFSVASLPFCLLTGGAGTGKTTTLTKALELILLDNPKCDILLSAPTGKAAQRLNQSLQAQLDNVSPAVRETLTNLHTKTLHRLLGVSERTGRSYKNADNPLACQVLAIDEASMISSDLLAQVLAALPADAKLILLGDANQLPPINSVAFFNDVSRLPCCYTPAFATAAQTLIDAAIPTSLIDEQAPLANHLCQLTTARRFAEQSLIERVATATLQGKAEAVIACLDSELYPLTQPAHLYSQLADHYPEARQDLLAALPNRMILCANRQGEIGSERINHYLDDVFRARITGSMTGHWYQGRQILIERNYPDLELSNGDIGRCHWSAEAGEWHIAFDEGRQLPVKWLPNDYSLAFAITIHKSQGSEYEHVDLVLDQSHPDRVNTLITPALIYTGVTRARQSLSVFSDVRLLQQVLVTQSKTAAQSPLLSLWKEQAD